MKVRFLLGFDTEAPFDQPHREGDIKPAIDQTIAMVKRLSAVFDAYRVSRTFFLLGKFVEEAAKQYSKEELREIFGTANPLVDIGSHAYSHRQFRHVPVGKEKPTLTPVEVAEDIRKADKVIFGVFGIRPIGLRAPRGYASGLDDERELIAGVKNAGINYVSSDLRDREWRIRTGLFDGRMIRQPRAYANGLVEIPSHGWQDMAFSGLEIPGVPPFREWDKKRLGEYIVRHYTELMDEAIAESEKRNETIYLGGCFHPQAVAVYDNDLKLFGQILERAKEKGVTAESYASAFAEIKNIKRKI